MVRDAVVAITVRVGVRTQVALSVSSARRRLWQLHGDCVWQSPAKPFRVNPAVGAICLRGGAICRAEL
jgi:hypothetical protein